jgi:hypothetical protein
MRLKNMAKEKMSLQNIIKKKKNGYKKRVPTPRNTEGSNRDASNPFTER